MLLAILGLIHCGDYRIGGCFIEQKVKNVSDDPANPGVNCSVLLWL